LTENDSPDAYAANIEKFFLVLLQCLNDHPSHYNIPLSSVQKENARSLFQGLLQPEDDLLDCFHKLCWSLVVVQPDTSEVTCWSCPFLCYFTILVLGKDGNFFMPDEFSSHSARFKYFATQPLSSKQMYTMRLILVA
jgi:hypothetical protein